MSIVLPDKPMNEPTGRLTSYDHDEIRAAFRAGITVAQLAAEYDRRESTIKQIIRRRSERVARRLQGKKE